MNYQLVFQGELTQKIDKKQAVVIFSKLFSMKEEDAERRFFSKDIIIKKLTDKALAEEFQSKLYNMGIVVEIHELSQQTPKDTSTEHVTPVTIQKTSKPTEQPLNNFNTPQPLWRNKLVILSAIVMAFIVIVASSFIYAQRLTDTSVPSVVMRAESILLTPESIVLGHVNMTKIVELEQLFSDTNEDDYRYNPSSTGIINALLAEDINIRRDLQQLVFSLNHSEANGSYLSAVLAGNFNKSALYKGLARHYDVTEKMVDGLTVLELVTTDRSTCKVSEPIGLIGADNLIVISHPNNVGDIFKQVQALSEPKVINQNWVDYRSQHLVSIGVLQPDNLKHASDGFMGMMLSGISKELKGAESIFAGFSANLLPPSGSVDMVVNSNDIAWVESSKKRLKTALSEQQQAAIKEGDFLGELMRAIAIVDKPNTLGGRFTVDVSMVEQGKKAFQNGLSGLMSLGGGSVSSGSDPLPEKIDENVKPYIAHIASLKLPEFESKYGQRYHWQNGPMAARVKSLRINTDNILELDLEAVASGIPNAPSFGFGNAGELTITSIQDESRNQLLAVETCGSSINTDPAEMTALSSDGMIEAKKTVRLIPEMKVEDIASIQGLINLTVATDTQTHIIAGTSDEMTVEQHDMYLRIKTMEGNNVSFVVSGDQKRLLSIRAMNANKQYLSRSGSSSFGDEQSKNVSTNYHGDVAYVEVISAVTYKKIRKRFTITNPLPLQRDNTFASSPKPITPYNLSDWPAVKKAAKTFKPNPNTHAWLGALKVEERLAAGILSVYDMEISNGFRGPSLRGNIKFDMPYMAALENIAGRVLFDIKKLTFTGNEPVLLDHMEPFSMSFTGFGNAYKDNSKSEAQLRKTIYLSGYQQLNIDLGEKDNAEKGKALSGKAAEESKISSITGDIVLKLPKKVMSKTITPVTLGKRFFANAVTYNVIELSSDEVTISAEGDTQSLLDIRVLDKDGNKIGNGAKFYEELLFGQQDKTNKPRMLSDVRFNGEPAEMQFIYATSDEEKRYAVTLDLTE